MGAKKHDFAAKSVFQERVDYADRNDKEARKNKDQIRVPIKGWGVKEQAITAHGCGKPIDT